MKIERRQCQECKLNRQLKFFVGARGRICITCQKRKRKLSGRLYRVLTTYGLSVDDYWALYAYQGGRCHICHGKRRQLDVDHDHSREHLGMRRAVRGLACARCNRWAIPGVGGDPYVAFSLGHYLLHPPAHAILGTR